MQLQGEYDPFEGSSDDPNEYDRYRIYTRSTNKHDHSANMQLPIRREHYALMVKLSNDERFPDYTSPQAIARDAIHHRLKDINEHIEDFEALAMLNSVQHMDVESARDERRRNEKEWVRNQESEILQLQADMDWDELETKLIRLEAMLETKSMFPNNERILSDAIQRATAQMRRFSDR